MRWRHAGAWLMAAACLLAAPAAARRKMPQPEHLVFAGLPWGMPGEALPDSLRAHGWKPVRGNSPHDVLVCTGMFFGRWSTLQAHVDDQHRLGRVTLRIEAAHDHPPYETYRDMRGLYGEIVTSVQEKYGPREEAMEKFEFPYDAGDGNEDKALADGLATIRSTWQARAGDELMVSMDRDMGVQLAWTAGAWVDYQNRRRQKNARTL